MRKLLIPLLICFLAHAAPVAAQTMEIAALVNDEVISRLDVEQRISLLSLSSPEVLTADDKQKIYPQVLRNLIDERIQVQEARRLNITASEAEVLGAIARISAQNNIPPAEFEGFIAQKGGNYDSFLEQIKSTIIWTKVIRQKFSTTAIVTEDEIQDETAKRMPAAPSPEYLLSEIFLPFDDPASETEAQQNSDRLVQDILKGAPFNDLARQFSKSGTAENGGDMGWIKASQLPEPVQQKIAKMQPNQITRPLRTNDGFVILFLRETRTPEAASIPAPDRQAIADALRQKKLESAARKYLRDLRGLALIDIRS
jgi:peptidyl-prolyl cis-trans isomerase SurA